MSQQSLIWECGIPEENQVFLTPLKPIKNQNIQSNAKTFYTFDVETKDGLIGKELLCWDLCYSTKGGKLKHIWGYEDLTNLFEFICKPIEKIRNSVKEDYRIDDKEIREKEREKRIRKKLRKYHYRVIYVHNLSFDIRFIIEYCIIHNIRFKPIISGSQFIACILYEYKIKFEDTVQFLQTSQEKAEIEWNIPLKYRKEQTDSYKTFNKSFDLWNMSEIFNVIEHNENDTTALYYIMKKFRKTVYEMSNVDVLSVLSIASLAMKAFRYTMDKPILNPFLYLKYNDVGKVSYEINHELFDFVKQSYYGGRNEVFDLGRKTNVRYYDVVSLFPYSMWKNKFPCGNPIMLGKSQREIRTLENIIDGIDRKANDGTCRLGFIEAIVKRGNSKTNFPIIPKRILNRVMFTNMSFKGVYTSVELEYARKKGYEIIPIRGVIFPEKQFLFRKFVNKFFKIKKENVGGRKKGSKIILNGSYGKFGQEFIRKAFDLTYHIEEKEVLKYCENHVNPESLIVRFHEVARVWMIMEPYIDVVKKSYMIISIASFTTAYSRLETTKKLHEIEFESQLDGIMESLPIYTDTDSISLESKYEHYMGYLGNELGNWDIEQTFDEVQFLAPKAYMSIQGNITKLKLKGVDKNRIESICKEIDLKYEKDSSINILDEVETIVRKEIQMREVYMKFKEAFRFGMVMASKIPKKHYTYENLKRKFDLKSGKSIPWNDENALPEMIEECKF